MREGREGCGTRASTLTSENGHSIREDPSLKNGLKNSKKWKHILVNLAVPMCPCNFGTWFAFIHMAHDPSLVCHLSCVE